MTDCRCLFIVIGLLMAVVYAICIVATKTEFQDTDDREMGTTQQSTESGKFLIELISTKGNRFVRSGPVVQELKIMELYELQKKNAEQVFNMKIYLKINWIDDFRNQASKAYRNLELLLIGNIEDLFDKKYYAENKSIAVEAIEMRRVKKSGGVMIKTRVTSLDADIEIEELKMAIEDGAQVLYDEIAMKLSAGALEASASAEMANSTETFM